MGKKKKKKKKKKKEEEIVDAVTPVITGKEMLEKSEIEAEKKIYELETENWWYKRVKEELREWKDGLYEKIKEIEGSLSEREEELTCKFQEEMEKIISSAGSNSNKKEKKEEEIPKRLSLKIFIKSILKKLYPK